MQDDEREARLKARNGVLRGKGELSGGLKDGRSPPHIPSIAVLARSTASSDRTSSRTSTLQVALR